MIAPRFAWSPAAASSLGDRCIAFWEENDGRLFDWQKLVIRGMLGLDGNGMWASFEDGLNVARQNGKGVILQAVETFFLFELGYELVTHTAHEFKTSREHMHRVMAFVRNAPALNAQVRDRGYMTGNGNESLNLADGRRLIFQARSRMSGRGFSGDLLVWDEAMELAEEATGAQMPNLRASDAPHGPKIIYAGSAVDQESMPHGVSFARIRERGLAQGPGMSWHEWSAPVDHPDQLTEEMLEDRSVWRSANPSLEDGLIREEHMEREIASLPTRQSAVELFGVGDWPRTDGLQDSVIDIGEWDALEDQGSVVDLLSASLAIDVSPERTTAIALAGRNQNDDWHVEIQEHRQGTRWVVDRVVRMIENGAPEPVFLDAVGPANSLKVPLEEAGIRVETVSSTEHGASCGRLVDMVADRSLAHHGSAELRDAVRGAKKRPLGDSWAWSRKNSTVDISPLVAATLALGAAAGVTAGNLDIVF